MTGISAVAQAIPARLSLTALGGCSLAALALAALRVLPLMTALAICWLTAVYAAVLLVRQGFRDESGAHLAWWCLAAGLGLEVAAQAAAAVFSGSIASLAAGTAPPALPFPPLTGALYLAANIFAQRRGRECRWERNFPGLFLTLLAAWVLRDPVAAELQKWEALGGATASATVQLLTDCGAIVGLRIGWRHTAGASGRRALVFLQLAALFHAGSELCAALSPAPAEAAFAAGLTFDTAAALALGWTALPRPARLLQSIGDDDAAGAPLGWVSLAGGSVFVLLLLQAMRDLAPAVEPPAPAGRLAALAALSACLVFTAWTFRLSRSHQRRLLRTARKEAVRLRSMLDSINDAVVTEDPTGTLVFANQRFYRIFGLLPDAASKPRLDELLHPGDRPQFHHQVRHAIENRGPAERSEFRGIRADGSVIHLECSVSPSESGGIPMGVQAVLRDISRQRLIETSQRAMAQRLEFFFSKMPLGCIIWDLDFAVQEWNESAERIFGWPHQEVLRQRYEDFLAAEKPSAEVRGQWERLRRGKTTSRHVCRNHTKNRGAIECEWFHTSLVDESGAVVAVASMVQDVTERTTLERQLAQSQKLEAVGTLAGGIAHDFNNLLTTILGQISLAIMNLGPAHPVAKGLRDAEHAAERGAELTQKVLRFSRKRPPQLRPVNVNDCIHEVMAILRHSIDPQIGLQPDLARNLWPVEADAGEIEHLIMNLCVNARDAIRDRGRIELRTANRSIGPGELREHPGARAGDFVEIVVRDTGCGMDEPTRRRAFDPFFTTKEVGKGSGLGLATVYGIVEAHKGWVEVESEVGEGTAFRMYLPRTRRRPEAKQDPAEPVLRPGNATILLADDEQEVRRLARETLERQGHRVVEAGDGVEAVEVFEAQGDSIGLIILDLAMPRLSGWEALERIRARNERVPVIISSGYAREGGPRSKLDREVSAFLGKPYKAQKLLAVVQEVLAQSEARNGSRKPVTRI